MIIKAQSPAAFAEAFIIESIWSKRFAPGSMLPAERELADLIGVTRTTLREVLQRLARDGWLTIQHGKPTKVNDFWQTSGLNILETLARLDQDGIPELVDQLLSARTHVSAIYLRAAVKHNPQQVVAALAEAEQLDDDARSFSDYDYRLHHALTFAANNPIYALILNGFKGLSGCVGGYYFTHSDSRQLARQFYRQLGQLAVQGDYAEVPNLVRRYGVESGVLWQQLRHNMPKDLTACRS